jgi:acid phosphatase class B
MQNMIFDFFSHGKNQWSTAAERVIHNQELWQQLSGRGNNHFQLRKSKRSTNEVIARAWPDL